MLVLCAVGLLGLLSGGVHANSAPVLDNSGTMSLSGINEDNTTSPGNTIAALIATAGGNRIADVDAGAIEGIAVIAVDNSNGAWEYDTGGGWTPFGTPTASAARLLGADTANNKVRFVPTGNFTGSVDPGITFRAWDKTTGSNGSTADISGGGARGGTTAYSTAAETAAINITTAAVIGVPPGTIAFGNIPVNVASVLTVTVSNTGGSALSITNIVSDDTQFVPSMTSLTVAAGATGIFNVTFTPTSGGNQPGTLTITSSDVSESPSSVSMTGFGTIRVLTDGLNFGVVERRNLRRLQATVLNQTGAAVTITSIWSSDTQFTNLTALPLTIPNTNTDVITVQFLPTSSGNKSATLTISYNPDVTVSLTGCGFFCDGDGDGADGDGDGDGEYERAPLAVPFGGEMYLLLLVVGYGIYALSRRRH